MDAHLRHFGLQENAVLKPAEDAALIERSSFRGCEDQVPLVSRPSGSCPFARVLLADAMLAQCRDSDGRKVNPSVGPFRLGLRERHHAVYALKSSPDLYAALYEINVFVEWLVGRGGQHGARLVDGQELHLCFRDARRVYQRSDITLHKPVLDRGLKGCAESPVNVPNRSGRQHFWLGSNRFRRLPGRRHDQRDYYPLAVRPLVAAVAVSGFGVLFRFLPRTCSSGHTAADQIPYRTDLSSVAASAPTTPAYVPAPDPDTGTGGLFPLLQNSAPAKHPWRCDRTNADTVETRCPARSAVHHQQFQHLRPGYAFPSPRQFLRPEPVPLQLPP
jgi:hypothetical protein